MGGKTATVGGQDWIFPSGSQCLECHTVAASRTLGLEPAELNRNFTYPSTGRTANQLETFDAAMLLSAPLAGTPADLPALVNPADAGATLADRARTYLHVNCSHCHRPGGPTPSTMDLRFDTAFADTGTCGVPPQEGDLGLPGAMLVAPGDSANSILAERMRRRDANGMPPLGSNLVDTAGVAVVENWIDGLSGCP